MDHLFTIDNFFTLLMLILLQAVLGFDNLLYISIESARAPEEKQSYVRKVGIGLAIFLRIGLLFALYYAMPYLEGALVEFDLGGHVQGAPSIESLIVLGGGAFIIWTAIKEIWHMISMEEHAEVAKDKPRAGVTQVIFMIVLMNVVFSFDSILSAMALTDELAVMTVAIVIGGILMIWLADAISNFLKRNRLYEVLGLFILLIVGIMLVSEGGESAKLVFWGSPIEHMNKGTFYFVIAVLVIVDIVQGQYQKKLMKEQEAGAEAK